ncbi:hypothetical protein BJX61DRAFT_553086 [Aspergillus egyptiacus]|nr:hypothetical protein BJX61DRAFT_553086 [Aspergillus egyptiacus]
MAPQLPLEIWTQIALNLEDDAASLPKYARVCRLWQSVFERVIYRRLHVESEPSRTGKGVISLSQFQSFMSGATEYRRSFLRSLHYTIATPHDIRSYEAVKLETQRYTEQNPIREANNQAFSKGIRALFEVLEAWDEQSKVTLTVTVRGRDKTLEPETKKADDLDRCFIDWEYTVLDGEQWVIRPYHARFPDEGPDMPRITCVKELSFENNYVFQGVWSGTAFQIAEHCVALRSLYVDFLEWVRPDHLSYMQERRQGVSSGLAKLPSTLRSLELAFDGDEPWSNVLPALDLRFGKDFDEFSSSLRRLSVNLQELKLSVAALELDFLFPLNELGAPTPEALSLYWPYLESITLVALPMYTPSGEWLFDYNRRSEDPEELLDPSTGFTILQTKFLEEEVGIFRSNMRIEHFHRLFISVGYAAQRMPRLKMINISFVEAPSTDLEFTSGGGVGRSTGKGPTLKFESQSGYKPDERVAAAWGFNLDDLEVDDRGPGDLLHVVFCKVALDRFPLNQ